MDFDANGMLPAGIHTYDMLTFREQFVTCFPASQTRPVIFGCLEHFVSAIFALCEPDELWVDGSFATTKTNPNDADLIIFVDYADFVKLKPVWGQLRLQYPHVDMYIACAANEKSNVNLDIQWNDSLAASRRIHVLAEKAPKIISILDTIDSVDDREVELTGKLTGINIRNLSFEMVVDGIGLIQGKSKMETLIALTGSLGQEITATLIQSISTTKGNIQKVNWYLYEI